MKNFSQKKEGSKNKSQTPRIVSTYYPVRKLKYIEKKTEKEKRLKFVEHI